MRNGFGKFLAGLAVLAMCGPLSAQEIPTEAAIETPIRERPMNAATLQRLQDNLGMTLQWISWDYRGKAEVRQHQGAYFLTALQVEQNGMGNVFLDGKIVEAGDDYFIFSGLIRIAGAPDADRVCELNDEWRFAITQNRKYYRLRKFEWCDGLADYIDIYF